MSKMICVVGDKFKEFSKNNQDSIIVFSQLMHCLSEMISSGDISERLTILLGQGVTENQVKRIQKFIFDHRLEYWIEFDPSEHENRVTRELSHKHKSKNRLVSGPRAIDQNFYESHLVLDEGCAEISDHLTGQHLQGMVLIEAARQMTVAVTEKYFIPCDQRNNVSFVTDGLNASFNSYVFPSEVILRCKILEYKQLFGINAKFLMVVEVFQGEVSKAELRYEFSTINKSYVKQKEQQLAQESISKIFAQHNNKGFPLKEAA